MIFGIAGMRLDEGPSAVGGKVTCRLEKFPGYDPLIVLHMTRSVGPSLTTWPRAAISNIAVQSTAICSKLEVKMPECLAAPEKNAQKWRFLTGCSPLYM